MAVPHDRRTAMRSPGPLPRLADADSRAGVARLARPGNADGSMLGAKQIAFLQTASGAELLAEAAAVTGELLARLTRLRLRHAADLASAAVELLELRARAAAKFSRADRMFFTAEGLEQSSGEIV